MKTASQNVELDIMLTDYLPPPGAEDMPRAGAAVGCPRLEKP